MSLSTIPSLCLLTILDRIPLHDLLTTVNLICHRWAQLHPVACHRRHSLFLLSDNEKIWKRIFDKNIELICQDGNIRMQVIDNDGRIHFGSSRLNWKQHMNALILPELSNRVCQQLVTLLPHMNSLQIGQSVKCWPTVTQQVDYLLKKWSSKLVHCSLWLYNEHYQHTNGYCSTLIDSLFNRLNQLTTLTRLAIHLKIPTILFEGMEIHAKLTTSLCPTLSRLEHFDYGAVNDQFDEHIYHDIEMALKRFECPLKTVTLDPRTALGRVVLFSSRLASKLTNYRLHYNSYNYNARDVLTVLSRFSSLDTLSLRGRLDLLNLSFVQLIGRISHLSQLTLLQLPCCIDHFFDDKHFGAPDLVAQSEMPSVKALDISFYHSFGHSHLDRLSIPELFPNVQVIKLVQSIGITNGRPSYVACVDCDYHLADIHQQLDGNDGAALLEHCTHQSVKSLKQCVTLREIYFIRSCFSTRADLNNPMCVEVNFYITPDQI